MTRTILRDGIVVFPDDIRNTDVLICEDKIESVCHIADIPIDCNIIDCRGKYIFPGVIDPHTHMGIPIKDRFSVDDFDTGTLSALQGGVTTIIDFSVLHSNESLRRSIIRRKAQAAVSHIDYSLHCNITRYSESILNEIPELIESGIISFKVFTTYKESGMMLTTRQIENIAYVVANHGGILMAHAEDDEEISKATQLLTGKGLTEAKYHGISRPVSAEVKAVRILGEISDKTGCRIYIVHRTSREGLEMAGKFSSLIVETCPQYLLLDDSVYEHDNGRMYVASPPLRSKDDLQALWHGITEGKIHTIGSDHCPFCQQDKLIGQPFQDILNGMGGVDTVFPVLAARFFQKKLNLNRLVQVSCEIPAKLFGLYPKKGALLPGSDADLIVVDPSKISLDWERSLVSITDWNAYSGYPAIFPEFVFTRGIMGVAKYRINRGTQGNFLPGEK